MQLMPRKKQRLILYIVIFRYILSSITHNIIKIVGPSQRLITIVNV